MVFNDVLPVGLICSVVWNVSVHGVGYQRCLAGSPLGCLLAVGNRWAGLVRLPAPCVAVVRFHVLGDPIALEVAKLVETG